MWRILNAVENGKKLKYSGDKNKRKIYNRERREWHETQSTNQSSVLQSLRVLCSEVVCIGCVTDWSVGCSCHILRSLRAMQCDK